MSGYHLVHCIPDPRMHGLNGYKEVIETVRWGLQQLGHQASYAVNELASDATNIIFGAQVMPVAWLQQLPDGTIIYNFEQLRGTPVNQVREEIKYCAGAGQFRLWDYTQANVAGWLSLGRHQVMVVPVGYAPVLTRIPKPSEQDLDVLIYGMSGERRLQAFHALSQSGLSTAFLSGLYGQARDDLIARSKIVLNINLYRQARIFEIVRVSYLLANKKAVVADLDADTSIDADVRAGIKFVSSVQELLNACLRLVEDDRERASLEETGFSSIRQRDIRGIIERALPS
jgi:hypothetical protein